MTEDDVFKMVKEGRQPVPEEVDCFCCVPDRYYLAMWFINNPPGVAQGDLTALVWRKLDDPLTWFLRYRHRYYAGPDPFDDKDAKSWHSGKFRGDERAAWAKTEQFFDVLSAMGATGRDVLIYRCDGREAYEKLLVANRPWLHMQQATSE